MNRIQVQSLLGQQSCAWNSLELEQSLEHQSKYRCEKRFPSHRFPLLNRLVVHVLVRICYRTPLKERLCVGMFYSLLAFKQVRDGTDVPKEIQDGLSQLQLLRPARRLPQRRCHFAEVGSADSMVSARHNRLCAHALANAGASLWYGPRSARRTTRTRRRAEWRIVHDGITKLLQRRRRNTTWCRITGVLRTTRDS